MLACRTGALLRQRSPTALAPVAARSQLVASCTPCLTSRCGSTNARKEELLYIGPLTAPIKTLKRVSITTCAMSMIGTPLLLVLGNDSVPLSGQIAVTGVALTAAVGSTALLHWCTRPYVHKLSEITGRGAIDKARLFKAELLSILGRPRVTEFRLGDVQPQPDALRPFVSFKARDNYYFIQGEVLQDKALLKELLGRPLDDSEKSSGTSAGAAGAKAAATAASAATPASDASNSIGK
ncbi:hypothetical protein JKP88DRAFT_205594 [Tribonema minus]|uniref:Transmembrane protein 70 homolog, mitochondrial n=1 Tax=Tribonema minus TaxID=303371 RepID=A0A835ZAD4_9STRA|nr:hypothetical protein JKP88DRAFT_205594 [Tribonema minus]